MATMVKTRGKLDKKTEIIDISSTHTDEEVLALEEKGYRLRFSEKDFRELDETTIEGLSKDNARDYFVTKGAVKALERNAERAELGFEGLEVLEDPLRAKPRKKMEMRGVPKGWHPCWKRPDEIESSKELGYVLVPDEVQTPGASRTTSSRAIAAKDGKDDLIAMMVPERLFQQHLHANAILSRKRAGATMKEINRMVASSNKDLEMVADIPNMTETTSVEEVPIREDMRRR
jgi:hypothetical protein